MHIEYIEQTTSTHEALIERLASLEDDQLYALQAGHQTAGRGRRDRAWVSSQGDQILLSMAYKPPSLFAHQVFLLNMMATLAVADVLEAEGVSCLIKWPNDVLINSAKVAGILIHNVFERQYIKSSVVSIGLNVHQVPQLVDARATSIQAVTGQRYDIKALGRQLVLRYIKWEQYRRHQDIDDLYSTWKSKVYGMGDAHVFITRQQERIQGVLCDVTMDGQIVVRRGSLATTYDIDEMRLSLTE